jgi:copper(I)-binding protein
MSFVLRRRTALLFVALASAVLVPPVDLALAAGASEDSGVSVEQAWARASAGAATTGAAYLTLKGGAEPDALAGVSTPVAASAEVHESFSDKGVSKMRAVPSLPIPAGTAVTLAPGGYHIMLTGLKQVLTAGQTFPLRLTFAHTAPVTVDVKVQAMGHGMPMPGHENMPMHQDMHMQQHR